MGGENSDIEEESEDNAPSPQEKAAADLQGLKTNVVFCSNISINAVLAFWLGFIIRIIY